MVCRLGVPGLSWADHSADVVANANNPSASAVQSWEMGKTGKSPVQSWKANCVYGKKHDPEVSAGSAVVDHSDRPPHPKQPTIAYAQ